MTCSLIMECPVDINVSSMYRRQTQYIITVLCFTTHVVPYTALIIGQALLWFALILIKKGAKITTRCMKR